MDQLWLANLQETQAANAAMLLMLYGMQHHDLDRDTALAVVDRMYRRLDAPELRSAHQVMTAYDEELEALTAERRAAAQPTPWRRG